MDDSKTTLLESPTTSPRRHKSVHAMPLIGAGHSTPGHGTWPRYQKDANDNDERDEEGGSGDEDDDDESNKSCFGFRGVWGNEFRRILDLSAPLIIGYFGSNAMTTTDAAFVGRLSQTDFAAMNLANAIMFGSLVLSTGVMNALCTLASQAYGAKRYKAVGVWLQVSLVWTTLLLVVPTAVVWAFTGPLLSALRMTSDAALIGKASLFARLSITWLLPSTIFNALSIWLEAMEIVVPQTVLTILMVGVNVGLNYLFVFRLYVDGAPLGLIGSPLATFVARVLQLFFLWLWIVPVRGYHQKVWGGWSRACLRWPLVREYFKLGVPIMLTEVLYDWVYEIVLMMTAYLAADAETALYVAIMGLLVNLVFFLTPLLLSVYISVSVRVGTELGNCRPAQAKRASGVAVVYALAFAALGAVLFYVLRNYIAYIYTDNADVVARTGAYGPPVAINFFISSLSYVLQGIVEGQGRPHWATAAGFVGNWCVGLPAAYVFARYLFTSSTFIAGLWWGLSVGEATKLLMLLAVVATTDWQKQAEIAIERAELEEKQDEERLPLMLN